VLLWYTVLICDNKKRLMKGIKKKTIIELELESIAFGGKAVAHFDGFTVFVERGLPGQKVKARIIRKKNNYANACIAEVISHSPFEIDPICSYFGICGGCLFQNLDYNEQLNQKRRQVKESLEHILLKFIIIEIKWSSPLPICAG